MGLYRRALAELEPPELLERPRVEELRPTVAGRDEQIAPVGGVADQPAAHDRVRPTLGSTGSCVPEDDDLAFRLLGARSHLTGCECSSVGRERVVRDRRV